VLSLFLVNERPPLDRDLVFRVRGRQGRRSADPPPSFRDRFERAVGHNTSVDIPRPANRRV